MSQKYLLRQSKDKPLYPDLIWSQPQNKKFAGKLLIVGGNAQSFAAVSAAYSQSLTSGIGVSRIVLPDVLQKTVSIVMPEAEFVPSTPSGSFGSRALTEILSLTSWADGVLIIGDMGRNSETAILLEQIAIKHKGQLNITKDALDYFLTSPGELLSRPDTLLTLTMAQLQKLGIIAHHPKAFTFDMDYLRLVEELHNITILHKPGIILKHLENIFIAYEGHVVSSKLDMDMPTWRVVTASKASVWWLQNPNKVMEGLATSLIA